MDIAKYYSILGLNEKATYSEIHSSYKQLAIKLHPDKEGGSEYLFKEVSDAYYILKDIVNGEVNINESNNGINNPDYKLLNFNKDEYIFIPNDLLID